MRLLFTVVHFFRGGAKGLRNYGSMGRNSGPRVQALTDCIASIHEHFGGGQFNLHHGHRQAFAANEALQHTVDVIVCTVQDMHLLGELKVPKGAYEHHLTKADPTLLGYECHAVLRERLGSYDYYCYLEDDLVMHDPLFFSKLQWFNGLATKDDLLQPNRYEVSFKGVASPTLRAAFAECELSTRTGTTLVRCSTHELRTVIARIQEFGLEPKPRKVNGEYYDDVHMSKELS